MLEPKDRQLLFEALRPPEGFRFDQGIGTTFSLDLLALLTAPLAFTWFEQQDEDSKNAVDALEVLESLRRHADQLTIFCHAGRIALPKAVYPQLAFLEESVVGCQPTHGGAFHPKVWALRYINDPGEVRYRVLCLSRNLTFSRAWDSILTLDGVLQPDRKSTVGKNKPLSEFLRALPRFARQAMTDRALARVERLASEVDRTEFELPDGMTDLKFWPLGIGGRQQDPLADAGDRLLIVSPFVTLDRVEGLAEGRKDVTLVSSADAMAKLQRSPKGVSAVWVLSERAVPEDDPDTSDEPVPTGDFLEQSGLHAKLYVSESGWDAHIWTGSPNATTSGFSRNIEFMIELVGPRKRFGIDALMTPVKGEMRFRDLLEDATSIIGKTPEDEARRALELKVDETREAIAGAPMEARVSPATTGAFNIDLVGRGGAQIAVPGSVVVRCWPVSITNDLSCPVAAIEEGKSFALFAVLPPKSLTSFVAFEIVGRVGEIEVRQRFVLNIPLVGAPEGRREQVLRSLVGDKAKMVRFLLLLLADEGMPVGDGDGNNDRDGAGGDRASGAFTNGLFELLLKNLDRNPERLDHLESLMRELRQGADGEDLFPVGFDKIWPPIWARREQQRGGQPS